MRWPGARPLLREAGRRIQGSAFNSVAEYESAIAAGHDLPPMPTLFVVADEFTLMLADHPEYAELFDYVARKGRSFRIHILFASQTLDVGKIKDIDKNTSYRIGSEGGQPVGVPPDHRCRGRVSHRIRREHKGIGFLVPAPGARSDQVPQHLRRRHLRSAPQREILCGARRFPSRRLFTAAAVEPDQDVVVLPGAGRACRRATAEADRHHRRSAGPLRPAGAAAVAAAAGRADPADAGALGTGAAGEHTLRWPLGEIDRPFEMRRDPLVFDARSAAGQRGDPRWSEVRQVDCAADVHPVGGIAALTP